MNQTSNATRAMTEQNRQISAIFAEQRSRLRNFIRRRVPDPRDAEDILQDAFYKLVEANRLLMPIDHVTSWLFRVARNRITDLFRKKEPDTFSHASVADEDGELLQIEDLLPSPDGGPEALYVRNALLDQLELALDELPEEQREVFVAHELDGRSFKELAAATGVSVNTLLSRKRYAVLHLRERLQSISAPHEVQQPPRHLGKLIHEGFQIFARHESDDRSFGRPSRAVIHALSNAAHFAEDRQSFQVGDDQFLVPHHSISLHASSFQQI